MKTNDSQSQLERYKEISDEIISGIQDGLSEREAVTLAKISWDDFLLMKKRFPELANVIEREKIKFKRTFFAQMKQLANEGNTKALDFLVANASAFTDTQDTNSSSDFLREAFAQIRSSSTSPVKTKTS